MVVKDKGKDRVKEKGGSRTTTKPSVTPSQKTKVSAGAAKATSSKSAVPQKRKNVPQSGESSSVTPSPNPSKTRTLRSLKTSKATSLLRDPYKMSVEDCRSSELLDTDVLDPDFSSGSPISTRRRRLPGPSRPSQNLFGTRAASVPRQLLQEFTVDPASLMKGFSKGQALSTVGKGGSLPGEVPTSGDLYASTDAVPSDLGRDSGVVSSVGGVATKATEPEIVIEDNSGDEDSSDDEDILNDENFPG